MESLLRMEGIGKYFTGVRALHNVSIEVEPGEVHCIVGENGAGKSTLMKILNGVYQPDEGRIFLTGEEIKIENPKKARERGISIVFQELNLCNELSVADNIFIGRHRSRGGFVDDKWAVKETQKVLDNMETKIRPLQIVRTLSIAEKQLIEIAKAVSINANILVFDEPTSSLTEKEIARLFEIIRKLRSDGKGIFYISHRLNELDSIADTVTVLRDGEHIITSEYGKITKNELIKHMVGREIKNQFPGDARNITEILFEARKVKRRGIIDVDRFYVRKGEIVGFAGLIGPVVRKLHAPYLVLTKRMRRNCT